MITQERHKAVIDELNELTDKSEEKLKKLFMLLKPIAVLTKPELVKEVFLQKMLLLNQDFKAIKKYGNKFLEEKK